MRKAQILSISTAPVLLCILFAVLSFVGIWAPNRFGTGMLWIVIAFLIAIWSWNTYVDSKEEEKTE